MLPQELVPVSNSKDIQPDHFADAFGVSADAIDAIVNRLRQESAGRHITNGDVEQVLLQFYASQGETGSKTEKCPHK